MRGLDLLELREQLRGLACRPGVTIPDQTVQDLTLASDVRLAFGHMPLGLLEVFTEHGAIHA